MASGKDPNAGLTGEQLSMLRGRLEHLRDGLITRIGREEHVAREGERLVEAIEAAEQTREQDDAVLLLEHDRAQLGQIERALADMETGRYGISEVSGAPIPFERLLAIPWARRDADEDPGD
jgi:DnaK suppressor protein